MDAQAYAMNDSDALFAHLAPSEGEGGEEAEEYALEDADEDVEDEPEEEADEYLDEEPVVDAEPAVKALSPSPQKPARLRRHRKLRALLLSKYDAVWSQVEALGWRAYDADREAGCNYNVCWSDTSVALERIMRMGRLQKINHFPGMLELVRKAGTARNLNKMLKACGKDYKFFPKTFMLPADYTELKKEFKDGKNHGNKTFIVKPSKGCQGKDIRLTRCLDEIDPHEPNIVQR